MTDQENDRLRGEFAAYREILLGEVQPAGPVAVRRAVRRRRRTATTAAAVGVLAVTLPLAARAGVRHHPAPAAVPTPAAAVTVAPSTPPAPTPGARITREELLAATVELPPWPAGAPCASGPTRLIDPRGRPGDAILSIYAGGYGDIDDDGVAEPVMLVRCLVSEGMYPEQVLAFDRDADGRIVVLGQVFRSAADKPEYLYSLNVRPDGLVRIEVTDVVPSGAEVPGQSHRQWRAYRWDGEAFHQIDGPTRFRGAPPS